MIADSDGDEGSSLEVQVDPKKAKAYLRLRMMNLLARREYSELELSRKLNKEPYYSEVLARLQDEGLQSDLRFAEAYLRSKSGQGRGPIRIRQELRQKGIADGMIAAVFEEQDINWFAILEELVERKYQGLPPEDLKERAKRQRFLAGRGFSFDMINDLLS